MLQTSKIQIGQALQKVTALLFLSLIYRLRVRTRNSRASKSKHSKSIDSEFSHVSQAKHFQFTICSKYAMSKSISIRKNCTIFLKT